MTVARAPGAIFFGVLLYVLALSLYAPRVTPPAPARLDPCARPAAERPVSCDGGDGATLVFGGDTAEIDAALPTIAAEGIDHPFTATAERLRAADLAVVNLEAPLTDGGDRLPVWKDYVYRAPPASAGALRRAGLDVAGLANNHVMDYGARGLDDTLTALGAAGIAAVGAGASEADARRGLVVELGAARIGLLAACERKLTWDVYVRQFALGHHPGTAALDEDALAADVQRLRRAGADLVVLLAHWGRNYAPPTSGQLRAAEAASRAGVDLVIGHHPHIAQPILRAGTGTPVVLSAGNYVFGTPGAAALEAGLLVTVVVRARRLQRIELWPIDVQNRRVAFRPLPLAGPRARALLEDLATASRPLGAHLVVDDQHAVWHIGG